MSECNLNADLQGTLRFSEFVCEEHFNGITRKHAVHILVENTNFINSNTGLARQGPVQIYLGDAMDCTDPTEWLLTHPVDSQGHSSSEIISAHPDLTFFSGYSEKTYLSSQENLFVSALRTDGSVVSACCPLVSMHNHPDQNCPEPQNSYPDSCCARYECEKFVYSNHKIQT